MYAGSPANCTDKHTHALKRDVPLSTSSHRRSPTYATCVPPAALPATVSPPHPHPYTMHPSKLSLPGVCPLQGGHLKGAPPAALLQPQWPPAAGQGGKSRVSTITSPGTAELPPCMHACMHACMQCGSAKSVHTCVPLQQQAGASAYHKHYNAVIPTCQGFMGPQGSSQVSSSHSTTPKANKSLAAVGRSPRSTSGACGGRAGGKGCGGRQMPYGGVLGSGGQQRWAAAALGSSGTGLQQPGHVCVSHQPPRVGGARRRQFAGVVTCCLAKVQVRHLQRKAKN